MDTQYPQPVFANAEEGTLNAEIAANDFETRFGIAMVSFEQDVGDHLAQAPLLALIDEFGWDVIEGKMRHNGYSAARNPDGNIIAWHWDCGRWVGEEAVILGWPPEPQVYL